MKIHHVNWWGIDHKKAKKFLRGEIKNNKIKYLGDHSFDGYEPWAVYFASNPDLKKNHKNIVCLNNKWVTGMTLEQFEKYRYQDAIYCSKCDKVFYSCMRHHFNTCDCGRLSIDGGRDYTKISFEPKAKYSSIKIDFLKQKVIK